MQTTRQLSRQPWLLGILLVSLVAASGCAKQDASRGEISGEVKLDGQPIDQASILFTPAEGTKGTVVGGQVVEGRYHLLQKNGPAVGWNRVEIRAVRKTGKKVQKPFSPQGTMVEEYAEAIASKFNSASTLTMDVKSGDNTSNFDITSK